MKKYILEIFVPEGEFGGAHHEMREDLTVNDLRYVVSLLDQIRLQTLFELMKLQTETNLKGQTKQ